MESVGSHSTVLLFLSISTQRLSGSSAMERELRYYINIGGDSARAEESAASD